MISQRTQAITIRWRTHGEWCYGVQLEVGLNSHRFWCSVPSGRGHETPAQLFADAAWSFATARAFPSGLAFGIRFGTEDFDHLPSLENNGVLFGFSVAQTNGALLTHRLGFFDCVCEEMRLMATVAFVG